MVLKESQIKRKAEVPSSQERKEKEEKIIIIDKKDIEVVRGNPVHLRIKEEKAKEVGINPERCSKEITKEEIEKLVNETCERNKNLEKECLLICIKDLQTKLSIYKASFDLLIDKVSKFTHSQVSLEGKTGYLEGFGFCELKEENGKIELKKIDPLLPGGYIISPQVLEKDILMTTSEVTGVPLEKLEEDLEKISYPSPQKLIKVVYGISSSGEVFFAFPHKKMVVPVSFKSFFSESSFSPWATSMSAIHEMVHLESSLPTENIYTEGEAVLAETNGGKKLAEKWKDVLIRQGADLEAVLMPETWLAEYLYKNGEKDTEVIRFLQKTCGQEEILLDELFGEKWDQGRIDEEKFEERKRYFARAYEIAKFFGENVKVSKISEKDWQELLKSRVRKTGEYKRLFKHPLEPEFLDYSLYEIGKGSLGPFAPPEKVIFLLEEKLKILKAEKELFDSVQREPDRFSAERERILEVLQKIGLTIEGRRKMVEKEIEKTKEKLKEAEEGRMENIHLEDLFWEIKQ